MSGFRKLDLSKFGGDSDSDDDAAGARPPAPNPKLALGVEKQATFSHGIQRKSKRDLEREQAKRKQEEEEREAARVFAEFTADFEGESSGSRPGGGFVRAGSSRDAYVPSKAPVDRGPRRFRDDSPPPAATSAPKPKGKRVMDSFLEDLKRDQAAREERFKRSGGVGGSVSVHAAWERERGSHDTGDRETTNVFVNNLPEAAKEPQLGMLFAKIGPVGSVKIFWPRFDEPPPGADLNALQSRRVGPKSGLTGFVAFMRRPDAERAIKEFDGLDWGGSVLRVSWSKAVKLPSRPIYVHPSQASHPSGKRPRSRSRSPPPPKRTRSMSPPHRPLESGRPPSPPRGPRAMMMPQATQASHPPSGPRASVNQPQSELDPEQERFIRTVAERVRAVGGAFEANLRAREGIEGKWRFLDPRADAPECHFYRLLVDPLYRPPSPPPKPFVDEGYDSTYSTDRSEASEDERLPKGKLGRLARRRLVSCLRGMRPERGSIARVMAMALKHADAAGEVADIVVQSLTIFETPVPVKVARLYLISDILSNSACPLPNAWKYRDVFEARLVPVFDHFGELYQSFKAQAGRLSAETFRGQAAAVLDVLDLWIVFPPAFIQDLRLRLAGQRPTEAPDSSAAAAAALLAEVQAALPAQEASAAPSKFKKLAFASTFTDATAPKPTLPPAPAVKAEDEEDLDGAPMGDDGQDLDGAPMAEEDDLDGAPMDDVDGENLDGEAM